MSAPAPLVDETADEPTSGAAAPEPIGASVGPFSGLQEVIHFAA